MEVLIGCIKIQTFTFTKEVRRGTPGVNSSPRMAHSSPKSEKKLGFPFFENGPSAVQGRAATSPFSDLGEGEDRGVTTPIIADQLKILEVLKAQGEKTSM
jgi:hypothetical protein